MSGQSNNKIIFGSAAGLFAVVALVWLFTRSGSAVGPSSPTPQPTLTMMEDEPVARSEPRGSTGGARLEGAAEAVEDEDDKGVTQKSKKKRRKKRQRRKQESDEEEQATGPKKGTKKKYFGK